MKTPTDAIGRYHRMKGDNVFQPIGFDAFGLPAENAAIKNRINPRDWTMTNIDTMRRQLRTMGAGWDWNAEVVTCDPSYYQWNQWLFLKFYEAGLAYRTVSAVDWCPNDGTLAREQVEGADRHCWRCGAKVEKRELPQWYLRTTNYADELLDFSGIQWPEPIRLMQTNWIGRSSGAEIVFETAPSPHHPGGEELRVFTTRPDTLYGATFMVLAPEHPLVKSLTAPDRREDVEAYVAAAEAKTEIDRLSADREKTGVPIGADAINPVNGERIPIFIADYVLGSYGTGAIMAVPAHDERDFTFAQQHGLPIRRVIIQQGDDPDAPLTEAFVNKAADEAHGKAPHGLLADVELILGGREDARELVMANSGPWDGKPAIDAWHGIVAGLEAKGKGKNTVTYRLRDWLISRQRYWGTPFPIIHCERDGIVPVPESDLPVLLPDTVDYHGSGENPLTRDEAFLNVTCPTCGEPAKRETDTMDTFIDSSWYWFRYLSPNKNDGPVDDDLTETWTPVDQYTGGAEHAVMHLLYSRFWTKAMRDVGLVQHSEPFLRLFNQGQILGADGERMSKSRGNVQDPDALVARYGADAVRLFLMFMGPVGPGRPVEPDRDRRRVQVPPPRVGDRDGSPRHGARRQDVGRPARGRERAPGPRPHAVRRAPDAARRHRGLRGLPLEHDGREAHGAEQRPVPLPRHLGRGAARVGRGRRAAAADARAGRAAHQRGAVVTAPGRDRRGVVVDPPGRVAGGRRARRHRADARGPDPGRRQAARPGDRGRGDLGDRAGADRDVARQGHRGDRRPAGREGHPRRRRPPGQHRHPGLTRTTRD